MRRFLLLILTTTFFQGCMFFPSSLDFSPDDLNAAKLGEPYMQVVAIPNHNTPVGGVSVRKGSLPPGLILKYKERTDEFSIIGTPTETGAFQFTIEAWCYGTNFPGQTGKIEYNLVVKGR